MLCQRSAREWGAPSDDLYRAAIELVPLEPVEVPLRQVQDVGCRRVLLRQIHDDRVSVPFHEVAEDFLSSLLAGFLLEFRGVDPALAVGVRRDRASIATKDLRDRREAPSRGSS